MKSKQYFNQRFKRKHKWRLFKNIEKKKKNRNEKTQSITFQIYQFIN